MPRKNTTPRTEGQERAACRERNFATIIYPDSAPEDWLAKLKAQRVPVLVSPLHDEDLNEDGTRKKPHYHVLYVFDTPKDFDKQVAPLFAEIGAVGRERVRSKRGYARYLCHLDNPEKAQYDPHGVSAFAGADYKAIVHLPSDDIGMLKDIMAYARANKIYSFAHLVDICGVVNDDWYQMLATSRGYIVREYVKSLLWEHESHYVRGDIIDPETGEVADAK